MNSCLLPVSRDSARTAVCKRPNFGVSALACVICISLLVVDSSIAASEDIVREKTIDFSRDIKPILSDKCFQCHGPDENQLQADLRLDIRDGVIGHAIEPGDPDSSLLMDRLVADDPEERMPPEHSKKDPLTPEEVELFRAWIEQGAEYAPHWSYQTPRSFAPPVVASEWVRNDIDQFVLTTLQQNEMQPSAQATPRTLARRLAFDLTGLPPDPKWIQSLTEDPSEENYSAFVETLLESETYGERMAMYWLDLVRYADTNGIHGDNHRDHDLYRDYVINAFNQNMPFDQFTLEQLAGDLLPNPTDWQRIASGYNRLNMTTREGGAQAKEYIAKYAADRVRNASTVWLGSTLGCAECHNHKYDPFTQGDFYRFAAFFADISETPVGQQQPVRIATPEQQEQADKIRKKIIEVQRLFEASSPELTQAFDSWKEQQIARIESEQSLWRLVDSDEVASTGKATLTRQSDGSWLASGENPNQDTYEIKLSIDGDATPYQVTSLRLIAMPDGSLTNGSLSRANGNFVLTNVEILQGDKPQKIASAVADFSQQGYPVEHAIDENAQTGWAVDGHNQIANRIAVFNLENAIQLTAEQPITIRLVHGSQFPKHNIGRFQLFTSDVDGASIDSSGVAADIAAALRAKANERSDEQNKLLDKAFREATPLLADVRAELASSREQLKALEASYRPILVSMMRSPLPTRILPRGNWLDESGELLAPSTPEFLPPIEITGDRATRLDLAEWFVTDEHPLVARVMVNRLWKICFGEGLVGTLDDFGSQGAVPTHPELLDWLAVEFINSGWDIKHMLRLITTSNAYRQDSAASPFQNAQDPTNRLLSHQNRFRLDAEMIRDNALTIGGLLVQKVGGPSVKPYQPTGYWSHLNFPKRTYQHDVGENQYRRGLYMYWCRTFLHPSLLAFDAPTREECTVQRNRSNTPLQALVLLNDPSYVEAARRFAESVVDYETNETEIDDNARLDFAYQKALNRNPTSRERGVLIPLLQRQRDEYRDNPDAASELMKVGLVKVSTDAELTELAAWVSVCRVILNLHETITRY